MPTFNLYVENNLQIWLSLYITDGLDVEKKSQLLILDPMLDHRLNQLRLLPLSSTHLEFGQPLPNLC